jgi:hypothetical protein
MKFNMLRKDIATPPKTRKKGGVEERINNSKLKKQLGKFNGGSIYAVAGELICNAVVKSSSHLLI